MSIGFFVITGKNSFDSYSDYEGHYGCINVSFCHGNLTFGIGSKNFDMGAAFTTASGFNISWSGGACTYAPSYVNNIYSKANGIKNKVLNKAKG